MATTATTPTTRTTRKCPWCGSTVRLAYAPIVATNLQGVRGDGTRAVSGLAGGEFGFDDDFAIGGETPGAAVPEAADPTKPAVLEAPPALPLSGAEVLGRAGDLPIVAPPQVAPGSDTGFFARRITRRLIPVAARADARDLPARACTTCHHPMPFDSDECEVLVIAVLGINRAGKTYLLATALSEALQNGALEVAGITGFRADEGTGNRVHRDYYLPVFRRRNRLDPTLDPAEGDAVEPLVFRFEVDGQSYLLALHDLAGEAIAEPRRRAVVAPFVRHADAILFVVDPLEIESVRTALPFEQITVDWRGWSQLDVLQGVIQALGEAAASTPVSVVLTKSDLIGLADGRRHLFDEPATGDWLEDQFAVDQEVRALLAEWGVPQFAHAVDRADRGFFHAVSAFGAAPTNPSAPGVVRPLRVTDPFGTLIRLLSEARSRP
ncbi:MAG: hypothetical protein QM572_00470 [Nocardioides sp.]|uniref:TRAFAC clade GTPase domain-containing protein n=1 Tax=Nocardioides sp. TaxID=35761 RepID=UPI0039E54D58